MVPGSHKLEVGEDHPVTVWSEEEKASFHPDAVAAEAPAGSVLLFDCRLYHTKAPNDTDTERLAVQVRYGAGWYYTRLNHSGHSGGGGPALPPSVLEQVMIVLKMMNFVFQMMNFEFQMVTWSRCLQLSDHASRSTETHSRPTTKPMVCSLWSEPMKQRESRQYKSAVVVYIKTNQLTSSNSSSSPSPPSPSSHSS